MWKLAFAALVRFGAGCAAQVDTQDPGDDIDVPLSEYGASVVAALRDAHGSERGHGWSVAGDGLLEPGWIVQTPPAQYWGQPANALPIATDCAGDSACDADFHLIRCATQADCRFGGTCSAVAATVTAPGESPRKLCTGHSDGFYDTIYGVVVGAEHFVDLASLEAPDDRFEAAVRNAITYLSRSGRDVQIRLLYGAEPNRTRPTADVLASLARDVAPGSSLRLGVGAYRDTLLSWNHTKLVAADGTTAIVGGHNMWTRHYLQAAPVHDLSMIVNGTAAADASRFVDELWKLACASPQLGGVSSISNFTAAHDACSERFATVALGLAAPRGSTPIITVGKRGGSPDVDEGRDAIVALVGAARATLRLSLQDIGPIGKGSAWPEPYLRALVAALARGVDIQLVLSNLNARPDGLQAGSASYSNGWTPVDVAAQIIAYANAHPDAANGADIRERVCSKLHATTLRRGADDTWPDGSPFANHAKLVIADDAAFYLGSENWYPAMLSELGYVVDDAAATRELVDGYFGKLWSASVRVAVNLCSL